MAEKLFNTRPGEQKQTVDDVENFLNFRGRLLDNEFRQVFKQQISQYRELQGNLKTMGTLKRNFSPTGVKTKSEARDTAESIKFAFDVFGRFVDIFDDTESYPRVSTEMAKWGAEEWLAGTFQNQKGPEAEKKFEERREKWFGGLERMMRAAESWRMLLSVNERVSKMEKSSRKLKGTDDEKISFVHRAYKFMGVEDDRAYPKFREFLDSYFVSPDTPISKKDLELTNIKDAIKRTDGFGQAEILTSEDEDPLFYEYMWMVVTGRTDKYEAKVQRRMLATARKESMETSDVFNPKAAVGIADEEDVKAGRAEKVDDVLYVDISTLNGNLPDWLDKKLRDIEQDAALEDEKKGAVWLTMNADLTKIMGKDSAFSQYSEKMGSVEKSLVSLSIPVSTQEMRVILKNYSKPEKKNELREAIITGFYQRTAALVLWHGFSADEGVYSTPGWASIAYHAIPPGRDPIMDNMITEKNVGTRDLGDFLSFRLASATINVMGSKGTGKETTVEPYYETAGSMEKGSWYVTEVMRAMGLLSVDDNRKVIIYSHSMGAQIGERTILPESSRGKVHVIVATPVSTSDPELNLFMHGNFKNQLGDKVIRWRGEKGPVKSRVGKMMGEIGRVSGIEQSIIRDMIVPADALRYGNDLRETRALMGVHRRNYRSRDFNVLAQQRANLEATRFAFAQYPIQELHLTQGVAKGSDMTVLIGGGVRVRDRVLDPDIQASDYSAHRQFFALYDLTKDDWEKTFNMWVNLEGRTEVLDHKAQVLVGKFGHYLNANKTGRRIVGGVIRNVLRRPIVNKKVARRATITDTPVIF